MATAKHDPIIKISGLIKNPFVRAAFKAAEDDDLSPGLVEIDHPRTLDGGAAELLTETAGRRVLAMLEG